MPLLKQYAKGTSDWFSILKNLSVEILRFLHFPLLFFFFNENLQQFLLYSIHHIYK